MVERGARVMRVGSFVSVGLIAWRAHHIVADGNLDAIVPLEAYRSGQFTGPQLRRVIDEIGFRSVVNLRGRSDARWYREEASVCATEGVRLYDLPLSGRELPQPQAMLHLFEVLQGAPRPLLIHCQAGTDRAGLAAVVYLVDCKGLGLDEAWKEGLSLWHGHVPVGESAELDRFLALYRTHGNGTGMEQWVREDYPAIFAREWKQADGAPGQGVQEQEHTR